MSGNNKQVDVAIIGAGFGGVGVGINLKKQGIENFVIFEGEKGVGGSWRTNTYPGCACDVPSNLYSYSFEMNPDWPESYSRQDDIRKYVEHCSDKYGVTPHVRFNTRVTEARFDESTGLWNVSSSDGEVTQAKVLVPATGALSHPKYPDLKGMGEFEGPAIHAARWDNSVELEGKRVAVIGSGATAIQVVPGIAPQVADLKVFQRTASWVLPRGNKTYSKSLNEKWQKHPWRQRARRLGLYWAMESALPAIMWFPKLLTLGEKVHKAQLKRDIKDPELRKKLTPDYKVGCKRTLVSDDWFKSFARDNVHLITDGIASITKKGIRTVDGIEHEFDVLIYATGYEIGKPAYPFDIIGLEGRDLMEYWGDRQKAYYGMNVAHFPNMLLIMGPNTGPGHTSVLVYEEAQYKYIAKFTKHLLKNKIKYLDVREDVMNEQWDYFQKRMKNSSWLSGCNSWYLNEDGTNSTMWPGFSFEYVLKVRNMDLSAYKVVKTDEKSDSESQAAEANFSFHGSN